MYLEKLEIQGFKSFAQKTTLIFPARNATHSVAGGPERQDANPGIAAIVGPNGSGKSNTADAVRWVLGEQSLKTLRGKKSEDIIFSGSKKLSRLGFAEVGLYLNNTHGRTLKEYSHIIIKRRLYRDGTSEYLINNNRVRLGDVQILLAQANFGQRTYSVIGQGMVDMILAASPYERKEFFDEATGVKQYQIKREQALHKITTSVANLAQATALLKEITPRLRSLERAVKKLQDRETIEAKLKVLQYKYYGHQWQAVAMNHKKLLAEKTRLQAERDTLAEQVKNLQNQLAALEKQTTGSNQYERLQADYQKALQAKSELAGDLRGLENELRLHAQTPQHPASGPDARALLAAARGQLRFLDKILAATSAADWQKLQIEAKTLRQEIHTLMASDQAEAKTNQTDPKLEKKLEDLKKSLHQASGAALDLEKQLTALRTQERAGTTAVFGLQKDYQAKQQALAKITSEASQIDIELARLETRKEDLEQEILKEAPEDLQKQIKDGRNVADSSNLLRSDEDLWPEIARAKKDLEMIGGIDPTTSADYAATRERHDWLSAQVTDLEDGITKTKQILKELETIINREFDAAFVKIEAGFSEYFSILFNGGKASLELNKTNELEAMSEEAAAGLTAEEADRLAHAYKIGIEIKASPPNKKVANISVLSGGERALTSIALICAIIRANPSPFVVLDEVDAALDEANSQRFAAILEKLAHYTQFIAITHNRATMEKASILYGVTMGEDGASKLLSVDLERAVETINKQ